MTESTEEERLFGSCSIHEAGVYKMLILNPEDKNPFTDVGTNMWTKMESILTENEVNLQAVLKL